MPNSPREKLLQRWVQLEAERSSYLDHYRDIQQHILPRRGRFLVTDRNNGKQVRHNKILDNTGTLAARTLASGMMAGLTSPARPWFRPVTPDPDMNSYGPVKEWLYIVQRVLLEIFARSNIYNSLHTVYKELGGFGTAPLYLADSFDTVIRGFPITVGSYALAVNDDLVVDTMYREIPMSVKMAIDKFGKERVSDSVKRMYDDGHLSKNVTVMHTLEPNVNELNYDGPDAFTLQDKDYRSVYWEKGADRSQQGSEGILQVRGMDAFRLFAPRWDIADTDVYGTCPGMDALGDVKELQIKQKWKGEGISKQVRPPMVAPVSMRNKQKSTLPGAITYVDASQGLQGFQPAYNVNFQLNYLLEDIQETKDRIRRAFYEDLFLMMASSDRREITAREVEERHEEKLLMLGPVLERIEDELLDPLISTTFNAALEGGLIPPPPEELAGDQLKIEYISVLAQAQKAVAVNTLERTATFVGSLAQIQALSGQPPQSLDKFDFDDAIDEYTEAIGAAPTVVVSDEDVAAIREGRAQAAAQAEQMAQMQQLAETAATAAQVKMDEENMVANAVDSLGAVTGQNPPPPDVGQP